MEDKIEVVPFLCRISKECHTMLKQQADKEKVSMSALAEIILRQALRKREPGALANELMFGQPQDELQDLKMANKIDLMLKKNDKV
tara:strand:+ start:161 stop:418 length:258 start_codon:yes stop_codon:yes gene_type:complete